MLSDVATTTELVEALRHAGEDFEWYPTTRAMVEAIRADLREDYSGGHKVVRSILDVGAGDGRVLGMLAETWPDATLYSIEKSDVLRQQQPDSIIPVGTEFAEQDLMSLPVDLLFSNPPYSVYEEWASRVVSTAYAERIYLILPQRWEDSWVLKAELARRSATATVIHRDDFLDADRRARAVVHVIRVVLPRTGYGRTSQQDPFDLWFDQNIDTFEREAPITESEQEQRTLAKLHDLNSIPDLVAAFDEDYARMQENYKAIFLLDGQLLRELGVSKEGVREGLKARMKGLKHTYWSSLFERLDVITSRLTTKTKRAFLSRLTGQTSIAFTEANAYAVVLWAIKAANQYFDRQVVEVFRSLATHDGVSNYLSNKKTWEKDGWRYNAENFSHFQLDYRVVLHHHSAIRNTEWGAYDYPGDLHSSAHEQIDDVIAVFGNLGFPVRDQASRSRQWFSGQTKQFHAPDGRVVFDVKAFKNGNLHFRFQPAAIKALNIEAGRLLGWLRSPAEAASELGCAVDEAERYFGCNRLLGAGAVKLLAAEAA